MTEVVTTKRSSLILAGLTLVAFGLRVYHLGSPPLLWDEGWSIGLSRLPLSEIARITALDVHPPLYYLLLKGWLALGSHEFVTRFLSVMAGVLTVPLGYHAGRAWRGRRVGRLTALYLTIAPPLIYYSQITRMFALCVMFLVLGTYGLLEGSRGAGERGRRGEGEKRRKGEGEKGRRGEREKGRKGEGEKGRRGEREKGRRGEGEKGRRGEREKGSGARPSINNSQFTVHNSQLERGVGKVKSEIRNPKSEFEIRNPKSEFEGGRELVFVVGVVGALYSFYYAGFVVVALFVYALVVAPRRWRRVLARLGAAAGLYLPWVLYAAPAMLSRVGERTGFDFALGRAVGLAVDAFYGLVFPYGVGWPAVYAILAVVIAGMVFGARRLGRWVWLPVLAIGITLFGAALGAQAHMFAARYTIVASPFLALAVAGALSLLIPGKVEKGKSQKEKGGNGVRSSFFPLSLFPSFPFQSWLLAAGVTLILVTTVPTITNYVYAKSYEVFDPFDPSVDWRVLHELADSDDLVFFNVLSLAGTYERYREAGDPPWSYALRWDPVVEPLEVARARIEAAAVAHDRLWFVLYKGTVAANADLKAWLDQRFYPAQAPGWRGDTLYLAYVDPRGPWRDVSLDARFGDIVLEAARYTPETPCPTCGVVGLDLIWRADGSVEQDAKVFVHLYDAAGQLVAQHDSVPVNGTRPPATWRVGEALTDRHGLALPEDVAGPLQLVVGLYEPATGERLRTSDGRETVVVGTVVIRLHATTNLKARVVGISDSFVSRSELCYNLAKLEFECLSKRVNQSLERCHQIVQLQRTSPCQPLQ